MGKAKRGQSSGQQLKPLLDMDQILNGRDLSQLLQIHLVSREIFKYLDGSALINLSLVNKKIRHVVCYSSPQFKKCINLMVNVKTMDFFTKEDPLPPWTAHLNHLTLICNNSQLGLMSQDKFSSLTRVLPSLSTLVLLNNSESYQYAAAFINKILSLTSNLKSLTIPYDLMLNNTEFPEFFQNLKELKFTTASRKFLTNIIKNERYSYFYENLEILAENCVNLSSFSCQELAKLYGRFDYLDEDHVEDYQDFFNLILTIIENNSQGLEKLEFGISTFVVHPKFSSKFAKVLLPNLKFLDLRGVRHLAHMNHPIIVQGINQSVLNILKNNLPQPGQLSTLKISLVKFPFELFNLISQKFPQLKSLSLKGSTFTYGDGISNGDFKSTIQSLTELEELEITKFSSRHGANDFGQEILKKFPDNFENENLRKLSLKGIVQVNSSTFLQGICKMNKLKEFSLTGSKIYLDDFMKICRNLKCLEKLEISYLHCDKFNPQSDAGTGEEIIDYPEILSAFSSLKYLKEISIEIWSGDFQEVFGSISFPYLKTLTLCNTNLDQKKIQNLIGLNEMLKEVSIVTLKDVEEGDPDEDFIIINDRKNLKVDFSFKPVYINPKDRKEEIREDCDPDSKSLDIIWPYSDSDSDY